MLALPEASERVVGVYLPSYATASVSYRFGRGVAPLWSRLGKLDYFFQRVGHGPLLPGVQLFACGGDIEDVDGLVRFGVDQHHLDVAACDEIAEARS